MTTAAEDWDGPTLYEGKFRRDGKTTVTLRVTVPRRKSRQSCACDIQILGYGDATIEQIVGADELQALTLALQYARRLLSPLNLIEVKGGSPLEFVLPEFIPIGYGVEFRNYLSGIIQLEVAKKELAIADEWRRKKNRRRRT